MDTTMNASGIMPTLPLGKNGFDDDIIILFLFFAMMSNGGWGNNGFAGYQNEFIQRDIFNTNQNVSNTACNTQRDILDSKYQLGTNIQENRFATQLGQANTDKEILQNRYDNALQTQTLTAQNAQCCCDLKTAIHAEGEATRALLTQNRIADLEYQLGQANTAIANSVQTQNILNTLGNYYSKPAVNPYTAYNTCNCGNMNI